MGDIKNSASASLAALGGQLVILALSGMLLYTYVSWMAQLWHKDVFMFVLGALLGAGGIALAVASVLLYMKAAKKSDEGLE